MSRAAPIFKFMSLTLHIPDHIEAQLARVCGGSNLSRKLLELIAVEGYREELLTRRDVGQMLGFDRWQVEAFLRQHDAPYHYDIEELEADRQANRSLVNDPPAA